MMSAASRASWIALILLSSCSPPPDAIPAPSALTPARGQAAPKPDAGSDGGMELLNLIDAQKDAVAGTWGFHGGSLWTSQVERGRLQLPVEAPDEYDLHLRVIRRKNKDSLALGLVIDGRQATLVIDGFGGAQTRLVSSGPEHFKPEEPLDQQTFLPKGVERKVLVQVRKDSVLLKIDGKDVLSWKGHPADLRIGAQSRIPNERALSVGTWASVFQINEIRLVPVSGTPKPLRA